TSGRCSMCSPSRTTIRRAPRRTSTRRFAALKRRSPSAATWPSWARFRAASIRTCASAARDRCPPSTSRYARSEESCRSWRHTDSGISSASSLPRRRAWTRRNPSISSARAIRWSSRSRPSWGAISSTPPRTRSMPATDACSSPMAPVARAMSEKAVACVPCAPRIPYLQRFRGRLMERYSAPPAKGLLVFPDGSRPFSERLASVTDQALQMANVHVAVKSVWGPVPLELDHIWPMSQTIVPEVLDVEALEAAEVFFREWAAGAGFSFGLLWEGEATLDELRTRAPGGRTVDWNALRIRATADFQFGRGAADALLAGTISYIVSKNTGKVRNVHVD